MSDDKQMKFKSDGDTYQVYDVDFPTTRFQGSKRDISSWVWSRIGELEPESLLDVFGGTGAISFQAKRHGVETHYNDYLRFNYNIGLALIENKRVQLTDDDIDFLMETHDFDYPSFIQKEFEDLYYTDDENRWLDRMRVHIRKLGNQYKKALSFAVLSQAAIAKRPYNLFHRANLYMRTEDVDRSFGNKSTWDKSFEDHFREKVQEYNNAVFDNGQSNQSYNKNVMKWSDPPKTDVVYMDPPYYDQTKNSSNATDYQFYYHFLEGYIQYEEWPDMIDDSVKTKRLNHDPSPWTDKNRVKQAFEKTFEKFSDRDIVLSYNTAGYPSPEELKDMIKEHKSEVKIHSKDYQYALSEEESQEILIVGTD